MKLKMPWLLFIARIIPAAKEPNKPWIPKTNGTFVEKLAFECTIFYSAKLKIGCRIPAIMPSKIAATGLKMKGALVPMIAAPAKVPYIRSFILILPFPTADIAKEVTTHVEMHQ